MINQLQTQVRNVLGQEKRPVLTIFFQFNPWGSGIGGIDTLIRSYVKFAPEVFRLKIVGIGDPSDSAGKWRKAELEGKKIDFLPLFLQKDGNIKPRVPNSLRYTMALAGLDLSSDFMHFHRIEPGLVSRHWRGEKTLFFHMDIEKQLNGGGKRNEFLWRRFPRGYFALEKMIIGRFDRVLECSSASLSFHQHRYPELAHRFGQVRNCVDTDTYFPLTPELRNAGRRQLAQSLGLEAETRFILFAGRLQPVKDPLLILRAVAAIDRSAIHLLLAGDGNMRPAVEAEIVKLGLQGKVSLLGAQDQKSLARLQSAASVFALTSAFEGLPLVVLEALASGTPVVATPVGEMSNVVLEGSGLVSEERTVESVVRGLRYVLDRPDLFPTSRCVEAAEPYSARLVLGEAFQEMLVRWMAPGVKIPQLVG